MNCTQHTAPQSAHVLWTMQTVHALHPPLQNAVSGLPDAQRRRAAAIPSQPPRYASTSLPGLPCRRVQRTTPTNMCARDHAAAALLRFRAARLRTFFFFVPLAMLARAVPPTRDAQRPRRSGTAWRPQASVVRLHASTCRGESPAAKWPVRSQLLRCLRLLLKVALPSCRPFNSLLKIQSVRKRSLDTQFDAPEYRKTLWCPGPGA